MTTIEEATKLLKMSEQAIWLKGLEKERKEAEEMAIKSLEAWENVKNDIKGISENPDYKPIGTYDYVKGSEDCREVVLEIIDKHLSEVEK